MAGCGPTWKLSLACGKEGSYIGGSMMGRGSRILESAGGFVIAYEWRKKGIGKQFIGTLRNDARVATRAFGFGLCRKERILRSGGTPSHKAWPKIAE